VDGDVSEATAVGVGSVRREGDRRDNVVVELARLDGRGQRLVRFPRGTAGEPSEVRNTALPGAPTTNFPA